MFAKEIMKNLMISFFWALIIFNIFAMELDPAIQMKYNAEDFLRIIHTTEPAFNRGIIKGIPKDLHYPNNADLYKAMIAGDLEVVKELIERIKAESISRILPFKPTVDALSYKIAKGSINSHIALEIIKLFLEAGVNQEQLDGALETAIISGDFDLGELLINHGAIPKVISFAIRMAFAAPK